MSARSRRTLLPGLLLLLGAAAGARAEEEARVLTPMENFLPGNVFYFVSVRDSATLLEVLARSGVTPDGLAASLADGSRVAAGSLGVIFEILAAAADGPVTFSLHREVVPGRSSSTPFLVSVSTRRKGDHLKAAGRHLLRGFLAPRYADSVREETIAGMPVLHLSGPDGRQLYTTQAGGFLLVGSSAILLGQVLKEIQSPSVKTLRYVPEFEGALEFATESLGSEPDGFLFLRDPLALPGLAPLGVRYAFGVLSRKDGGFLDRAHLRCRPEAPLARLRSGAPVPGAWADMRADHAWIGASLDPAGVRGMVLALMGEGFEPFLGSLAEAAQGEVEALLPEEGAPVLRVRLKPGVDPGADVGMLTGLFRRAGDVLLLSENEEFLARVDPGTHRAWEPGRCGALKAPLPLVLAALGAGDVEDRRRTVWSFEPGPGAGDEPEVVVASGTAEVGPVQAAVAALFR
jgi:hypothetical protein